MAGKGKTYLLSIDFRSSKGGISRLANLIYESVQPDLVYSLHGKPETGSPAVFFNSNTFFFLVKSLFMIYFRKPRLVIFDHLNIARLLVFVPSGWLPKVVIYLHDEEAWRKETGFLKMALTKATHILCNSEFTKRKFLEHNLSFTEKTKVCLPGGVSSSLVSEKKSERYHSWLSDKRPYCLFVSRLWKEHRFKGYRELLQAFRSHYKTAENPFLRLAIIGNGDDSETIQSFIQSENLTGSVSLFQNVLDRDLRTFYENSLSLFFPSSREGFGMVYLEAMSFKKACIGIKAQPAEEIIVDEETGVLLEKNHPMELQRIIADMEKNPDKYIKYGMAGYDRYMKLFTKNHFKNRFLLSIEE